VFVLSRSEATLPRLERVELARGEMVLSGVLLPDEKTEAQISELRGDMLLCSPCWNHPKRPSLLRGVLGGLSLMMK
jgi:hypothetical protein